MSGGKVCKRNCVGVIYQEAEPSNACEGGGDGGTGKGKLAEVTDEHDRDHGDEVLQEPCCDQRPSKVQLLSQLSQYRASGLLNTVAKKGLIHVWHHIHETFYPESGNGRWNNNVSVNLINLIKTLRKSKGTKGSFLAAKFDSCKQAEQNKCLISSVRLIGTAKINVASKEYMVSLAHVQTSYTLLLYLSKFDP